MFTNILDYLRIGLYIVLAILGLALYQMWEAEHPAPQGAQTPPAVASALAKAENTIPSVPGATVATAAKPKTEEPAAVPSDRQVQVKTDLLEVTIDTLGGDIIAVSLPHYAESLTSKTPYVLLNNDPKTRYVAQSGLLSPQGPDNVESRALYTPEKKEYTLEPGQNELTVNLSWHNNEGIKIIKSFVFHRDDYEIDVVYHIDNNDAVTWTGNLYNQLLRTDSAPSNGQGLSNLTTYFGAAISSPDKPFQKLPFKELAKKDVNQPITGGWAAMVQHYFVSAWIPDRVTAADYYSKVSPQGLYTIGMVGSKITVPAHEKKMVQSKLYAGPAITDRLEKAAPGLNLTIDYGVFWFISIAIFWLMQKIYTYIGNWGWAIILTTLIIKLMFYHLSAKSYRSMSKLKKLQPRMEKLKQLHANDKQKMTQATLDLYRTEKVNPAGGCLPMLIQIPVFIALYWVLVESVQLRQAPFMFWIHDLTAKDPYYILPILVGLSMFLQQKLSPPPPDPTQAKVMMLMPIIFTALFINFPSGLMLYWFVNTLLSVAQQWYIMRTVK